jgi:hypothetical protein
MHPPPMPNVRGGTVRTFAVPEYWQQLGFSGRFHAWADLTGDPRLDEETVAALEARLPARVPFDTNSGTLALGVDRESTPPRVLLVRSDAAAICDLMAAPVSPRA